MLTFGLIAMCVGLAAGLFGVILPRIGEPTRTAAFLRMAALTGVLSVGAGAMYVVRINGGGPASLIVSDTSAVLACALLCVAVRPPTARRVDPTVILAIVAGSTTAISSTVLPAAASMMVRAGLLAATCATCAVLAARDRTIPRRSMRVLSVTMSGYALFCLVYLVALTGVAGGVAAEGEPFGPSVAVGVSVVAMLSVGVSVALAGAPAIRIRSTPSPRRTRVAIGDWDLAAAAYGTDRVRALLVELRRAARDLDPHVVEATHGVETSLPRAGATLRARMRDAHGWTPEELQLLTDVRHPRADS